MAVKEDKKKDCLETRIMNSRNIAKSSLKQYLASLKKLRENMNMGKTKDLNSCKFLYSFSGVMSAVEKEKKLTMRKNRLTAVLVALGAEKRKTKKVEKLIKRYGEELKSYNEIYDERLKKQKKSKNQEKNWLEYSDLVKVSNDMLKEIKEKGLIKLKPKTRRISDAEFRLLQRYVLLRVYLEFPLRNDFSEMEVLTEKEFKDLNSKDKEITNLLVISKSPKLSKFHINNYKTKKFLGSKKYNIPKKLMKLIKILLRWNTSGFLFVKADREEPLSSNNITQNLNAIFKKYAKGKKISTSMIRHITISHTLKDTPTIAEKEEEEKKIEKKYLHSAKMNELYRKI
jgi:hypothetical protein